LEGKEIETMFKSGFDCPKCGQRNDNTTGAIFYRENKTDEWKQSGKIFECSDCRSHEALGLFMENSLKKQKNEIAIRLAKDYFHIPGNLNEPGFKNFFETDNVTAKAKGEAICFTKEFLDGNGYNLLIMGNPGTGKTHLSAAIARTAKEKGYTVGFLTTGYLLSLIKATYQKGAEKSESEILRDIGKLDLLILDDVGSEAKGGNDDWRKSMIFEVVESRSGKPTIYTSNLTDTDLPIAVGERVFSRLYDNTKFIDLFTEDYRKRLRIK
jgi:DNA replication protein DnaC